MGKQMSTEPVCAYQPQNDDANVYLQCWMPLTPNRRIETAMYRKRPHSEGEIAFLRAVNGTDERVEPISIRFRAHTHARESLVLSAAGAGRRSRSDRFHHQRDTDRHKSLLGFHGSRPVAGAAEVA
jgi:hypothetical protein